MSVPAWGQVSALRRAHIERVAAQLDEWAQAMRVPDGERDRWLRAGWLHDALRDAPLGDRMAHGPAAADRAAADGERDRGVLDAIRYHTIGFAGWDDIGRMLYLADFLEPGRDASGTGRGAGAGAGAGARSDRAELARRVPKERDAILREVARRRIEWVLRSGWPLPAETIAFWNGLAGRAEE